MEFKKLISIIILVTFSYNTLVAQVSANEIDINKTLKQAKKAEFFHKINKNSGEISITTGVLLSALTTYSIISNNYPKINATQNNTFSISILTRQGPKFNFIVSETRYNLDGSVTLKTNHNFLKGKNPFSITTNEGLVDIVSKPNPETKFINIESSFNNHKFITRINQTNKTVTIMPGLNTEINIQECTRNEVKFNLKYKAKTSTPSIKRLVQGGFVLGIVLIAAGVFLEIVNKKNSTEDLKDMSETEIEAYINNNANYEKELANQVTFNSFLENTKKIRETNDPYSFSIVKDMMVAEGLGEKIQDTLDLFESLYDTLKFASIMCWTNRIDPLTNEDVPLHELETFCANYPDPITFKI